MTRQARFKRRKLYLQVRNLILPVTELEVWEIRLLEPVLARLLDYPNPESRVEDCDARPG